MGSLLDWGHCGRSARPCAQGASRLYPEDLERMEFPNQPRFDEGVSRCLGLHYVSCSREDKSRRKKIEEMKVSVKPLFVGSNSSSSTRNAVDMACSVLGVAQLRSVIFTSPLIDYGVNLSLEHLLPYWEE